MQNIAVNVRCEDGELNRGYSNEESLKLIAEAGILQVFMSFQNEHLNTKNYEKYLKLIKQHNLKVAFVHLGYRVNSGIKTLWEEGEAGDELINDYIKDIETVASDGIKVVCMHLTKSNYQSPMSQIAIERLKKLTKRAEELGVYVALENTVWPGYIEFVLDNIDSPNLGVCFDSGHNHLYFKDAFNFKRFKNKIMCVHLHDNDGTSDQHMLPFDGNINWDEVTYELKNANYKGVTTAEVDTKSGYIEKMSLLEFFKRAKERLLEIDKKLFN